MASTLINPRDRKYLAMSCRGVGSESNRRFDRRTAPRTTNVASPIAVTPSDDTLVACDRSSCIVVEGVKVTAAMPV